MREIKFRAWNKKLGLMQYGEGAEGLFLQKAIERNLQIMQYTGLKDKNGKEIYEGDILKVSYRDRRIAVGMGVKPFEGEDKWSEWKESFVEIYTEPAMWLCRYTKTHGYHGHLVTINAHTKECGGSLEIIGNIYENPELIK